MLYFLLDRQVWEIFSRNCISFTTNETFPPQQGVGFAPFQRKPASVMGNLLQKTELKMSHITICQTSKITIYLQLAAMNQERSWFYDMKRGYFEC